VLPCGGTLDPSGADAYIPAHNDTRDVSTYTTTVPVRFRDIDAMGHVNNAVYATYLEQARTEYFRDVLDADLSSVSTVLASLSISFRRPIHLEDGSVAVEIEVTDIGESSVPMVYELRTNEGVVAEAESVQVAIDETGSSRPIPEAYRTAIESYHGL